MATPCYSTDTNWIEYDKYSILDCVEDCLRTTRCRSVNYHQGAHFCQTNFETNVSSPELYLP
uniref:Apple domain-containing protein n=1 Tax=Magallana gigas TaxID=29159 RepID=K1R234_MAGGI